MIDAPQTRGKKTWALVHEKESRKTEGEINQALFGVNAVNWGSNNAGMNNDHSAPLTHPPHQAGASCLAAGGPAFRYRFNRAEVLRQTQINQTPSNKSDPITKPA